MTSPRIKPWETALATLLIAFTPFLIAKKGWKNSVACCWTKKWVLKMEMSLILTWYQLRDSLLEGSKSAKLNISLQLLRSESGSGSGSSKLASLRHLEEKALVWKPDAQIVKLWSENISAFWTSPGWEVTFNTGQLAGVYDSTLNLQARHGEDILRLRFLYVFFYDLLCFLYPQHSHGAPALIHEHLASLIYGSSIKDHSSADIVSNLRDFLSRARRYHKLTLTFGDGILVELPVDVPRDA